jgi:hypothetical protein
VAGQCHAPATLLPGIGTQFPFDRRLGWPQVWSGWVRKSHHPLGFDPQTIPLVVSKIYLLIYFIDIVCVEQHTFKYSAVENIVYSFI